MRESATMKPTSCVYDVKCAFCHGRGLGGWWSLPGMRWDTRRRLKVFSRRMRLSPLTVAFRVQAARSDSKKQRLTATPLPISHLPPFPPPRPLRSNIIIFSLSENSAASLVFLRSGKVTFFGFKIRMTPKGLSHD